MKIFIALICALFVSSSVSVAQNIAAKDLDLACAVSAAAEIGSNPEGSVDQATALMVWTFYLGRLSGRDDKTDWGAVIKGRLAEMREKALSKEFHGKCMNFYTSKITE